MAFVWPPDAKEQLARLGLVNGSARGPSRAPFLARIQARDDGMFVVKMDWWKSGAMSSQDGMAAFFTDARSAFAWCDKRLPLMLKAIRRSKIEAVENAAKKMDERS